MQVSGKFLWGLKIFHVDIRAVRRNEGIFFRAGPHHNRQDVVTGTVIRTVEIEGGDISTNSTLLLQL
jgi:hypothetical protein